MMERKIGIIFSFTLLLIVMLSVITSYTLLDFVKSDTIERSYNFKVNVDSSISIGLPQVNTSDRIYLVLNTSSRMKVEPSQTLIQLPYDIETLPFEFEDWLLFQQRLCFIANESSSNSTLHLNLPDPKIPYSVKIFQGEASYALFNYTDYASVNYIGIHVKASKNQSSRFQQVILIYPYHRVADQNFQINGSLKLLSGKVSHVTFIIITRDRNWLPYTIVSNEKIIVSKTVNFNINLYNQTIFGRAFSEDFGKQILYVAVSIGLDSWQWKYEKVAYAKVGIGEIKISNGDEEATVIEPKLSEEYSVDCDLYVFRKFHPTTIYTISVLTLVFLVIAGALMLARLSGFKFELRKFFGSLTSPESVSDPRPNTYLAKLLHKPRYDRLIDLLLKFAGRKVSVLIDVGCGLGVLHDYIKESGFDVKLYVGCDVDKKALQEASSIERILCDVQHLPLKESIAEVVVCSEVLEHTASPNLGFSELLEVSKRWVFVSFPEEKLKNALGFRFPQHISEPNATEFKRLAEKKKFKLLKKEKKYFALPPSVFDKLRLRYEAFYRPIIVFFFRFFSIIFRNFSLIKDMLLVFKRRGNQVDVI